MAAYGLTLGTMLLYLAATVVEFAGGIALAVGRASDRPTYWVQVFAAPKLR
jgi:uncharacterized membrane protein YphA (DoxX/SURF4 family)